MASASAAASTFLAELVASCDRATAGFKDSISAESIVGLLRGKAALVRLQNMREGAL